MASFQSLRSIMVFAGLALAAAFVVPRVIDASAPSAPSAPASSTFKITGSQPSATAAAGRRTVVVPRDARGHFQVEARVDGRRLDFMVDTGASVIALSAGSARRIGINPSRNDFTVPVRTANGTVKAAPVMLRSVDVGGLVVRDVRALVTPDETLSENLLGLSYLTRLRRFEYQGGRLVLEN